MQVVDNSPLLQSDETDPLVCELSFHYLRWEHPMWTIADGLHDGVHAGGLMDSYAPLDPFVGALWDPPPSA